MSVGFLLDPTAENIGTQLDLNDGTTYKTLTPVDFPFPPLASQYVGSIDQHGDTLYASRYQNRTITLKLLVKSTTDAGLTTAIAALEQKAAKINRDAVLNRTGIGGVLQYTTPGGEVRKFDVCQLTADVDMATVGKKFVNATLSFTCLPLWRGAEVEA